MPYGAAREHKRPSVRVKANLLERKSSKPQPSHPAQLSPKTDWKGKQG